MLKRINGEPQIYLSLLIGSAPFLNLSMYVGDVDWGAILSGVMEPECPYTPTISEFMAEAEYFPADSK